MFLPGPECTQRAIVRMEKFNIPRSSSSCSFDARSFWSFRCLIIANEISEKPSLYSRSLGKLEIYERDGNVINKKGDAAVSLMAYHTPLMTYTNIHKE